MVTFADQGDQTCEERRLREAEDRGDVGRGYGATAERDDLVEQRKRIPNAPLAAAGNDLQSPTVGLNALGLADLLQSGDEIVESELAQHELLHAGENRLRNLLH